jgi:hypothetical protein
MAPAGLTMIDDRFRSALDARTIVFGATGGGNDLSAGPFFDV